MSTYHTFASGTYTLGSSIGSTDTSILLSSFAEPITGTPYTMVLLDTDIAYGTIAPKTTSTEFISFTGITQNANGTALLTGVTRGLARKSPFTSDNAYKLPHSGQSIFIISNPPQLYEKYPAKENAETVAGDWTFTGNVTFSNFPVTPSNSNASTTVKGVTKLSVAPVSATDPIAVGTNDDRVLVGYAVDAVGTDAYAITPTPAITAYSAGQVFTFKAGTANTGACTLAVSGLAPITIKKNVSSDLVTGDILLNQIVVVEYDGTNMQMVSEVSGLMKTSDYLPSGKIEVDPTAITLSGTVTETTLFDVSVPGGLLLTNNAIRFKIYCSDVQTKAAETTTFRLKYGGTTIATAVTGTNGANIGSTQGFIEGYIVANASVAAQKGMLNFMFFASSAEKAADANVAISKITGSGTGTATENSANALTLSVTAQQSTVDGNNSLTASFWVVEIIRTI